MAYTIITSTSRLGAAYLRPLAKQHQATVIRRGKPLTQAFFGKTHDEACRLAEAWARADAARRNEPFKYESYGED